MALAESPTPSPSSSSSTPSSSASVTPSSTTNDKTRGQSSDTPVTGDEATKVSAAVTAKDSTVTISSVRKDPGGSYDALGTKAGAAVMFDVSSDLGTITQNAHTGRQPARGHRLSRRGTCAVTVGLGA